MTSAAAISGALRRAGLNPLGSGTPRSREGVRVTASSLGKVRVVADLDSANQARRLALLAAEALVEAGYELEPGYEVGATMDGAFYVTGRAS